MRPAIRDLVEMYASFDVPEPIYEFGSYQVEGQESISNLRDLFNKKKYVGSDMREGPGVDILLNLHELKLPDKSVGTALLLDTIEHVEYPRKALDEIYRVLKDDGILIVSSVMIFLIHEFPYDYWRYTPEGMMSLVKKFEKKYVATLGEELRPHTVVSIAYKTDPGNTLCKDTEVLLNRWKINCERKYRINPVKKFLIDLCPPLLYRKLSRIF